MNSTSEMVNDKNGIAFIEKKCCIEIDNKKFCSGGSYLCIRRDTGKLAGILYGSFDKEEVSSWDGSLQIPAYYGKKYRNNFGAICRYVWFKYCNKFFVGRWDGIGYSQIVRVREITEKSYLMW